MKRYLVIAVLLAGALAWRMLHDRRLRGRVDGWLAGRPALDDAAFAALFPAGQGELAVALRQLLVPHAKVDLVRLLPTDRLLADLRLNDFHKTALAEYIMAIEEQYQVLFPDRDALDHATFGELVAALHALRQPAA